MAIHRASRRSSTAAAPSPSDPASTRSAAAAAGLDASSEGGAAYALRKRTRSGAGLDGDDEGGRERDGRGALHKKEKGGKKGPGKAAGKGKGKGKGAGQKKKKTTTAAAVAVAGARRAATKGRAKQGTASPVDVDPAPEHVPPPTSESLSMPGLVAAAVAAAEQEVHDDDDDLSSLTSLSDDEPEPHPPSSSPRASSLFTAAADDDERSIDGAAADYADDDEQDDDDTFDPVHPNRTSRPRRKSTTSDSRKSSASSSTSSAARPARAASRRRASLSPVVEVPVAARARAHKPGPRERARRAAEKAEEEEARALATSAQRRRSTAAQVDAPTAARRTSTDLRPLAMPTVVELYDRRGFVLDQARVEATSDVMLQRRSENAVESAIEALETGTQQTALCLAMNRFSAWCADKTVQIPVFPLTGAKLALFLARCTSTPLGSILLSTFPQPAAYPLPVADCLDVNLTADEGNRLTRELVKCWVDALSYAQMATFDIWAPHIELMRHHQHGLAGAGAAVGALDPSEPHPSLRPLHEDRAVLEVLGALEPAAHMQRYEERMRASISLGTGTGGGGGVEGVGEATVALALAQVVGAAGEMGPPSGTGKDKGKGRAVALGGEQQARAAPAASGKGKTKWVKGGKAVAPPIPLRGASSSSSITSHGLPPRSDTWTAATSPEHAALSRPTSTDWTTMHVPHGDAFAEPSTSFLEQASSTFLSDLGGEPTFANSFDEQYGMPFEPTSPRLYRRSSTSSLVLQPVLDLAAFPPLAPPADPFAVADSSSHDAASYLIDEQWRLSTTGGAPRRSRSVTHAARLENGSGPPASRFDLDAPAPAPAQAHSSYLPVRFAARQVGQSERPAPQQQQRPAPPPPEQRPHPRPSPEQQVQQRRPRPRYVEESQSGEQRFVSAQRATPKARPVGRLRTNEPHFLRREPPRHRLEPSRPVKEQPHVVHERPQRVVVEPEQQRVEPVEEYDPTRPQLGGSRLSLPPAPAGASRLHQRRNAIVATPPVPQPEAPPAFVIVNGQRYQLARDSPPPPDPGSAPTIEARAPLDDPTHPPYSMAGSTAPRSSQGGGEPARSDPLHEPGHPRPPSPDSQAPHKGFQFGTRSSMHPHPPPPPASSSCREQPAERVPSWTIPRHAAEPDQFFAQLVARTSSIHGTEPDQAHVGPPSVQPSQAQQSVSATPQGHLPHPAYLFAQRPASPPPYVDGPPAYVGAARTSCVDKWRRAAPDGFVGQVTLPAASSAAYPTPESPSGLFNGGEYPGIGPTSFVPLEGVVAAEIRGSPPAALEPVRPAQEDEAAEGAQQESGAQGQQLETAATMVGLGIGLE
ncbi:hypothetical protein JCM3775_004145 [Rhodotorula graminis]